MERIGCAGVWGPLVPKRRKLFHSPQGRWLPVLESHKAKVLANFLKQGKSPVPQNGQLEAATLFKFRALLLSFLLAAWSLKDNGATTQYPNPFSAIWSNPAKGQRNLLRRPEECQMTSNKGLQRIYARQIFREDSWK